MCEKLFKYFKYAMFTGEIVQIGQMSHVYVGFCWNTSTRTHPAQKCLKFKPRNHSKKLIWIGEKKCCEDGDT